MKKIVGILFAFLGIGFLVCFIAAVCAQVPSEVPAGSAFLYKFCNCVEYFLHYLPAIVCTGYIVGFSVYYGRNSEGSTKRFSEAMIDRYKKLMILSLVFVFILMLSNETFGVLVRQKKTAIINKPKTISEYIKVGNKLYENGFYDRSLGFANSVLKMDPNSKEARDLKSKSDMEINREATNSLKFDLTSSQPLIEKDNSIIMDKESMLKAYDYCLKAREAFENQNWFNAHYYAEQGIKLSTPKDPNIDEMKILSAEAWNNLTRLHDNSKTEEQQLFNQKYTGFLALMNKDDLQAYYIFRYLYENYPEMQRDPDVLFYFDIAQNRVEQKYFFVDETFTLESFEDANDVYFAFPHIDGTKDIAYFKGMTTVKQTGQSVQYLRDFTIVTLNKAGETIKELWVPYAKLMPVSVESLNSITKQMLEIDDNTKYVPYILLKSIGRDDAEEVNEPKYTYADGREASDPDYMLFPIDYDDFLMLEQITGNPEEASFISLFKIISRVQDFGYSPLQYGLVLLNRVLYPLFMLFIFILLAIFGWKYRIGATQYFRFSWVLIFPLIIGIALLFYDLMMYLFKLSNFVFWNLTGNLNSIWIGGGVYLFFFIIASIVFLSKKTSE